jgi:tripartite-type tricarboxylate transporter receptor subunit TctC
VIVDNRTSLLSAEVVGKAAPDGYTVLFTGQSFWIVALLQNVPYDLRDFSPVAIATSAPNALATHPSLPAKSVKDLIALAKARRGEINYGATGPGSAPTLAMELFKSMAGVDIMRINYKGIAEATAATVAGEVQVMFPAAALVAPHAVSGKLRVLAVTSAQPMALLPGTPTVAASGLPGYVVVSVDGILAPARTPVAIINRLNQEIVRHLNTADAKKRFLDTGAEVVASTPEEFAATLKAETATWSKVIKDAGIRAN